MRRGDVFDELDHLGARLHELDLTPPPLCHQRSQDFSEAPVYRSLLDPMGGGGQEGHSPFEEYEEEPVYRSVFSHADLQPEFTDEEAFSPDWGFLRVDDPRMSMSKRCSSPPCSPPWPCKLGVCFDLPAEVFDHVLQFLSAPDLFKAMAASRTWRICAGENYAQRCIHVPAEDDALLRAVEVARPGDTLRLAGGLHQLSRELALTVPVRILGPEEASGAPAVLSSEAHVVLRSRAEVCLVGLTLCRMGDSVGYPNAVVFAEAGRLLVDCCRITCGGDATIEDAVRVFDDAPAPGEGYDRTLPTDLPDAGTTRGSPADERREERSQDRPQSGLWIGAAACVTLRDSIIASTMGPGVKVYRGELEATRNTIAFSSRGANVVANGGKLLLSGNCIQGATGDGVSSWNNTHMAMEGNRITANSGSGIAINSAGGNVHIAGDNEFEANGSWDVHRPSAPGKHPAQARRGCCEGSSSAGPSSS